MAQHLSTSVPSFPAPVLHGLGLMPPTARRGRGALGNRPSRRFKDPMHEPMPELWDAEEPASLKTDVYIETPRSILTRNQSPDISFDRSINAYRGCEHGCIYCYARPSHAYLGLSPGLDFETKLTAKPSAAHLLEEALCKPGYSVAPIAMGTNTDPYQPIEDRYQITRSLLEVLDRFNHPLTITTKSFRVTRDMDILTRLARKQLLFVNISITTLDRQLARAMEPRASTPERRLEAIQMLSAAGVPVNVFVSPMIPGLNDHELEQILERAKAAGATAASSIHLRLPHEVKDLFKDWLATHYPDRAARVMHHIRDMREGRENDARFGSRMRGSGVYADLLVARFRAACARLALQRTAPSLNCDLFAVPRDSLFAPAQGSLFT